MEKQVCICGAGTMGRGIALVVAGSGMETVLYDLSNEMISNARRNIEHELNLAFEKKRISETEKENIFQRIKFTSAVTDCQTPLIIEAIVEKTGSKSALFTDLAVFNSKETIYASNTSSLSVTEIAEQTSFPERIIGLHFFNPANRMKLIEIIQTKYTTDSLLKRMTDFARMLNKTPVVCRDAPGFIVNHVARPYYLESLRLAEEGIADLNQIDRLLESAGFKMGPFHLMDLIGNDINYTVSQSLYEALDKPARLKPAAMQEEKVKLGLLGIKSGGGFFQYNKPPAE
jgi:3-hydroxybutyryl-CoA dehydrogenase